ncbi:MAG: KEOPS complex subunit Pcc1 [Thermoprotei archaeon]
MFCAELRIYSSNKNYIESLYKALHPDNITVPGKVVINDKIVSENNTYTYVLIVKTGKQAKDFDSLRGTLDEVLTLISMIESFQQHLNSPNKS